MEKHNTVYYLMEYYPERIYCSKKTQNVTQNGRNTQYCLCNVLIYTTTEVEEKLYIYTLQ
jgi:predicted transcriptional regulator with HTH domain